MTTWGDLARLMEARARRHGVRLDGIDALTALHETILDMAGRYDFDALTTHGLLAVTETGTDHYTLPEDFLRFPHPFDRGRSALESDSGETGAALWDGDRETALAYVRPVDFFDSRTDENSRPSRFTRLGGVLYVDPAPDDNDGDHYEIRGTYIISPDYPDPDTTVPFEAPMALMLDALRRAGVPVDPVEHRMALSNMVNNQHRQRQRFGVR